MQNKLQYLARFFTALLLLFVINGSTSFLYSQIVLNDNRTKEILFTDQNERETQSSIIISLKNYSKILSPGLKIVDNNWVFEDDVRQLSAYRYSKNSSGFALPGEIRIDGIDETVESAFSLKNASNENFGKLNISTDFVVTNSMNSNEISLVLKVENSQGAWTEVGRGVFYPDTNQNEQTFSVQIAISDVFIEQNDIVNLMWVNRSSDEESHQLYTHRIEITPQYSDLYPYQRGDLLITELMPMGDIDGFEFEYLEVFNPDGVTKSLKGLSIQSDYGAHTIQNDIEIPPYGYYIFSNADFSDVQNVDHSYFYSGNRLFSSTEPNGRVEILQNDAVIATAVYELAEQNVSFEIERMSESVDGYTGLQNLTISAASFMNDVNGSPGVNGSSLPVYRKTFTDPGVYLIALPGQIYNNMLRVQGALFYSVEGDLMQLTEIEPFEPVFMIKKSSDQIKITVEGVSTAGNSKIRVYEDNSHRYISPVKPGSYSLRELLDERNTPVPAVVGVWNFDQKRVGMRSADQTFTEMWEPVISRVEAGEASQNRTARQVPFNEENTFSFSLYETENDDELFVDEVWVEIDDANITGSAEQISSFFKEPLFHFSEADRDPKRTPLVLYGSYSGIENSGLSYFLMQAEKNSYSEFSLGIFNMDVSEQKNGVLRWDIPESIPEDWPITLTDRITGQEIDMQVEDNYPFRVQAQAERTITDNSGQKLLQQVEIISNEKERFSVRFEPPNLTAENVEETETPGSIELRQNYPNPFNPSTNITFFLPEDRQVRLGIFNIVGQQVATLIDDNMGAGEHSVVWNASNNPSGIYIVQLETGSRILTRKITLVK